MAKFACLFFLAVVLALLADQRSAVASNTSVTNAGGTTFTAVASVHSTQLLAQSSQSNESGSSTRMRGRSIGKLIKLGAVVLFAAGGWFLKWCLAGD